MSLNRNLPPVPVDQFAMVPRGDVPRSTFRTQHSHKTTFDANLLIPIFVDEVLPGDVFKGKLTIFCRMQTPLFPIMDELYAETFFFFVPNRLGWKNWVKQMGEQENPNDSISFLTPQVEAIPSGWAVGSVGDYFGLPIANTGIAVNALPFRAYNRIFNEWFRPEDFSARAVEHTDDGPDPASDYLIWPRFKAHDYFTSALPWPTKGNQLPNILIGGQAPVYGIGGISASWTNTPTGAVGTGGTPVGSGQSLTDVAFSTKEFGAPGSGFLPNVWADLSQATGATVNSLRLAVATQQLLERDARGGTRYTEILRSHFGVLPSDSRLQRPEYIGGGKTMLQTQAIAQTSATDTGKSPLGSLAAATTGAGRHEFSCVAQEHGFIIGLVNVFGPNTYQYSLHRMWTRRTRYDYYWPAFAFLGEQAIRADEIFFTGTPSVDEAVWGYQERWAEYRYRQSKVTGLFRSGVAGSLDTWHLAQAYGAPPTLNYTFLKQGTPIERVLAASSLAANQQFLFDSVFNIECTRALPTRSVPGLVRF